MGFLRDLIRKYHGSAGCQTLEDLLDTAAEKHLRAWVKQGCKGTPQDYAETINETRLTELRKKDQILLAQEHYEEKSGFPKDYELHGLEGAIERAAQIQVDALVKRLFLELASAGLAIQEELLKFYEIVEIKHQNPFRGLPPLQVSERHGFSFYEYLFDVDDLVHVYVSDYPYLGFVAKNLK